jgi:hypothetical protein
MWDCYICTICVIYDAYVDVMLKMLLLSFDTVMLWCWYDVTYKCCICCCWSYLRCKYRYKSKSCKMFMKFLRRKMLSSCILIYRWGLMPWSFCSTTTMRAYSLKVYLCSTTMRAYALKWYHMHLHFMMNRDGLGC